MATKDSNQITRESIVEKLTENKLKIKPESGHKVTVVTEENREELLQKIAKIVGGTYNDDQKKSSAGHVDIEDFYIVAKKPVKVKSSSGSGAGAYMTSVGESAQCYFNAAIWYGDGKFTDSELRKCSKYVTATIPLDEVLGILPDDWFKSCTLSAKALYKKFGKKKLTFHRGDEIAKTFSNIYSRLNKQIDFFSNINKWTPADIWMVNPGIKIRSDFASFSDANKYLLECIKNGDLIGVSLKKTVTATIKEVNFTKQRNTYKFESWTVGKRSFFESGDVYVFYDGGEMQFRNFAPHWQGEIIGKTAKHGKISGGPIKTMVQEVISNARLSSQATVTAKIGKKSFYDEFYKYYVKLVPSNQRDAKNKDDFEKLVKRNSTSWQIGKFMGVELINALENNRNKIQEVVNKFINYAKSESNLSAPHIKVL